jgi:NADH:ubiquinone oxidoreductase subunit 4 (subunit M)
MDFISENLLTILILLPVFGAIGIVLHQMFWKQEDHLKWLTLGITLVNFLISIPLIFGTKTTGFSFEVN